MEEIQVKCWSNFEVEIQKLQKLQQEPHRHEGLLFRGLGDSEWGLKTTLERSYPKQLSLLKYYRKVAASKPFVETFSERRWNAFPDFPTFENLLKQHNDLLDLFLKQRPEIYEYLVYLRHHGFPSPLLDWTASPYVAALFAFDE